MRGGRTHKSRATRKYKINRKSRKLRQRGGNPTTYYEGSLLTDIPKRLLYFKGISGISSALVTKLYKGYETARQMFNTNAIIKSIRERKMDLEAATRTLSNLYNLRAVRGNVGPNGLIFESSMTGPHHYGGYIDPTKTYIIDTTEMKYQEVVGGPARPELMPLPDEYKHVLKQGEGEGLRYNWIKGGGFEQTLVNVETGLAVDSLFDTPGILKISQSELHMNIITEPHKYDLRPYHAQIVRNDVPFGFDQELVQSSEHAQHKLRIVTYNYGDKYVNDYLLKDGGSGIFIERHDFIQAITPMNEQCGGFVILGKEDGDELELIGATVPYGYTLLVDKGSIHGDSTMTGLYMMAMTGNHVAMSTADTVFMKTNDLKNVAVKPLAPLPIIPGMSGDQFLISSNVKSLNSLRTEVEELKVTMRRTYRGLDRLILNPVVLTLGIWDRTHGTSF
jgi:hypothetical protein